MTFHDGAADGQPDARAIAFGCKKRIEHAFFRDGIEASAEILDCDQRRPALSRRAYTHQQRFCRRVVHCFDGILDEIDEHLLQLDPISANAAKCLAQIDLQDDIVPPQLVSHGLQNIANNFVKIE